MCDYPIFLSQASRQRESSRDSTRVVAHNNWTPNSYGAQQAHPRMALPLITANPNVIPLGEWHLTNCLAFNAKAVELVRDFARGFLRCLSIHPCSPLAQSKITTNPIQSLTVYSTKCGASCSDRLFSSHSAVNVSKCPCKSRVYGQPPHNESSFMIWKILSKPQRQTYMVQNTFIPSIRRSFLFAQRS